jgi:hypothetical protein
MNRRVVFFLVVVLLAIGLFAPIPIWAVTKSSGDLEVTFDEPLFPPGEVWSPGLAVSKPITIKNNGDGERMAALQAVNTSETGGAADAYLVRIEREGVSLYGGAEDKTMRRFWDDGEVNLSLLPAREAATYDLIVTMLSAANDSFQGQSAGFDLAVGFIGEETVTVPGGEVLGQGTGEDYRWLLLLVGLGVLSGVILLKRKVLK